ncbi:MAG: hypothetical protein ACXW25_00365, partial [Rhodospirillales bacterium]
MRRNTPSAASATTGEASTGRSSTLGRCSPARKPAGPLVDGIGDHLTILQLHLQRALDDRGWHLEQLSGHCQQLLARSPQCPSSIAS